MIIFLRRKRKNKGRRLMGRNCIYRINWCWRSFIMGRRVRWRSWQRKGRFCWLGSSRRKNIASLYRSWSIKWGLKILWRWSRLIYLISSKHSDPTMSNGWSLSMILITPKRVSFIWTHSQKNLKIYAYTSIIFPLFEEVYQEAKHLSKISTAWWERINWEIAMSRIHFYLG